MNLWCERASNLVGKTHSVWSNGNEGIRFVFRLYEFSSTLYYADRIDLYQKYVVFIQVLGRKLFNTERREKTTKNSNDCVLLMLDFSFHDVQIFHNPYRKERKKKHSPKDIKWLFAM